MKPACRDCKWLQTWEHITPERRITYHCAYYPPVPPHERPMVYLSDYCSKFEPKPPEIQFTYEEKTGYNRFLGKKVRLVGRAKVNSNVILIHRTGILDIINECGKKPYYVLKGENEKDTIQFPADCIESYCTNEDEIIEFYLREI